VAPDGRVTSTPKMPFAWRRITLEEKNNLIYAIKRADSIRVSRLPPDPNRPPVQVLEPSEIADYFPPIRPGQVWADPRGFVWILPTTSALTPGTSLTAETAAPSALVYDIADRDGRIAERVRLPQGRLLTAIAPNGVLYMTHAIARDRFVIERARVVRP
jgi:hypothetical protein